MARIRLLDNDEASAESKKIYDRIESNGARVLNLYRALAHNPSLMLNCMKLGNSLLSETALSPKLRELVILRIARLTGSDYEWAQHYHIALQTGVTSEQAAAIGQWKESHLFNRLEQAVLQYTDEAAQSVRVTDETFTSLASFLDEQQIVELTLAIGYWGLLARFLVPLHVDIDAQTAGSASDLKGHRR